MDRKLHISVGKSRLSKAWKNREITWAQLSERLGQTRRTGETLAEYHQMSKDKQELIKDIGGFVGGSVEGGRRVSGSVKVRSLVTLDMDNCEPDILDTVEMNYSGTAYCIYSTHKSSKDHLRLRMVMPLARDVTADEYGAVSRRVAANLGIDQMDDTTYQPTRLMYWPSTPQDQEFTYINQDGDWLDPDAVLATYDNWEDASSWPYSSRITKAIKPTGKKVQDPLEKDGVVGAFCRTYSMTEAIDRFLPDVYARVSDTRYTFLGGSTTGGLVIYDDKFAYSNHSTDPASMKECNAFDLVRIHKFGDQDVNAQPNTPISKLPSYLAMKDFAVADSEVKCTLTKEHINHAFDNVDLAAVEQDDSWMRKLLYDRQGNILPVPSNFSLILENDPQLRNFGGNNLFSHLPEIAGPLPWKHEAGNRTWEDSDDAELRCYMQNRYNLQGKNALYDAVSHVQDEHAFHPIRDYLQKLVWDGVPRVERLFIDYLGAEENDFNKAAARKSITAAIARVFHPGCKYDYMVVLVGPQGIGKSTLLQKLGGPWFSDTILTVQGKEAYEALQGSWILEMSELTATRKADIEAVKQFISKQTDRFRPAYGRRITTYDRQCVLFGTTNDAEFLKDMTGNRRYWVVEVGKQEHLFDVFDDLTPAVRDQLFAEATSYYNNGEKLYLSPELEQTAVEIQERHATDNSKKGMIEDYLEQPITADWYNLSIEARHLYIHEEKISKERTCRRNIICAVEILCELFEYRRENIRSSDTREINQIMDQLPGWQRDDRRRYGKEYGQQRGFKRAETNTVIAEPNPVTTVTTHHGQCDNKRDN